MGFYCIVGRHAGAPIIPQGEVGLKFCCGLSRRLGFGLPFSSIVVGPAFGDITKGRIRGSFSGFGVGEMLPNFFLRPSSLGFFLIKLKKSRTLFSPVVRQFVSACAPRIRVSCVFVYTCLI